MPPEPDSKPFIMVAPNGARRGKVDHPALPIEIDEIIAEAEACRKAGADALHLHVRDRGGRHSLDPGLYREALQGLAERVPDLAVQITTESAGIFDVSDQLRAIDEVKPRAASISVREIARDPTLAPRVYRTCADLGVAVQHIVYERTDWLQLNAWQDDGVVQPGQDDVIFVLGQYAPPRAADIEDFELISKFKPRADGRAMVCAFGRIEQRVLCAAAKHGFDLRIGFENNTQKPDCTPAVSNAANVAGLFSALSAQPASEPTGASVQ